MQATDAARSALMRRVRQKDTGAELAVRRAAHAAGMRFRLGGRDLPGSPDLVFPGRRLVVFVHGCFWHRHENCRRTTTPKTNTVFWNGKFAANVERDERNVRELEKASWSVEVVWECQALKREGIGRIMTEFAVKHPLSK